MSKKGKRNRTNRQERLLSQIKNRIGKTGYDFVEERPLSDLHLWKEHRRLKVFFYKGFECANPFCDNVGTRLICGKDFGGGLHWDIYTDDLILMTVDHILARANGGGEELENKQPMCSCCNSKKSDKVNFDFTPKENTL